QHKKEDGIVFELLRKLRYLLQRGRMDAELNSEMEAHREMMMHARRTNFGSVLRLREEAREAWGWMWLDRLGQDLRYGIRVLARTPGFTLMAVLVLAVGIGINIAAFSLFDMLALEYMPVPDANSLVRLERRSPTNYTSEMPYPSFAFYRDHSRTLAAAMAVLGVPPLQIENDIQGASSSFVTANYFAELGAKAAYGRVLSQALDGKPGSSPVAVISYGLWRRRFGSDPEVIGRIIHVNRKPVQVVGVLPDDVAILGGQHPDLWMPMSQQPYLIDGSTVLTDFDKPGVRMWGRLAPGVTMAGAEQELRALTNELRREHPAAVWDNEFLQVSPGGHLQVMRPEMYQVAAMVGVLTLLILAVACGNLGALLLARAVQREREMRVRLAIGASGMRIFRQLITESLLLALAGGAAGLALGCAVVWVALLELDAPKWLSATPDVRVLLFTLGVSFVSATLFGFAPALQIARQAQHKTLARQILVTAQVAGSCVLLIAAGLLVHAAQHALYTHPGFGFERLITIDGQMAQHGYHPAAAKAYLDDMRRRLERVPGVRSTALVLLPPLGHTVSREDVEINGRPVRIYPNWVTPNFFETMQIPVLLGHTFAAGAKNVVVVSESFARRQWPGQNPLGQRMGDGAKNVVVGVVGDARVNALSDDDAVEQYWPATQDQMAAMVVVLRTDGPPADVSKAAEQISTSLDPKLFPEIRQIKTLYNENAAQMAQLAGVVSLSGVVAVLLASVGVIGLVSFTVWQRTKDIAIRLALGASDRSVLQTILRQFFWPSAVGLVLGTSVAAMGSKILRRALFGVGNLDVMSYGAAILLLVGMLAVAALIPARRALRVNLSQALHYQ
ncbi:MAG TPA: ABC transporter permease, partial [Bryobacteraceae bacterium]